MNPGVYPGMPREKYEQIDAVNYSTLKHLDKSPGHMLQEKLNPPEPSEALDVGTATHIAILEPDRFEQEYVVPPKVDRRTKDGKAEWAAFLEEHAHQQHIDAANYDAVVAMRDAVYRNPTARAVLQGRGANELVAVWEDTETGLLCKGAMDRVTNVDATNIVVDVKTLAGLAKPRVFEREIARRQYHVQAGMYTGGLEELGFGRIGEHVDGAVPLEYWFIVVEKSPPHASRVMKLATEAIQLGRDRLREYLKLYAECLEANRWPLYPTTVPTVSVPPWAFRDGE